MMHLCALLTVHADLIDEADTDIRAIAENVDLIWLLYNFLDHSCTML